MQNSPILYVKLVLTMAIWGGTFVAGRVVSQTINPFTASFSRFAIASVCLGLLTFPGQNKLPRLTFRQVLLVILLGLSGVLAYNIFFFVGLKEISASRAGLIIALNPVAITISSRIFFQEKLTSLKIIGIFISFLGAALVITEGNISSLIAHGVGKGELSILGCVVSWVIYSLLGKLAMQELSALTTTTYAIWSGTILLLPLAIGEQKNQLPNINLLTGVSLAYLGVLGTVVAFNWYYDGIKAISAAKAAIFINLVPVFAIIFSVLFLQESLSYILLLGGSLVILGVSLVNKSNA
ncbi:DMT family transporter [Pleurocapsa sp. PCC 7319]|uniref:DMT family transporter n=1 Tax=Pleurocapsa sp. PCC 7319 TaxID=118161 RepID=UPI00036D4E02|nr:DMT family transporter [Pleurocapsa sp. PCC 7319]